MSDDTAPSYVPIAFVVMQMMEAINARDVAIEQLSEINDKLRRNVQRLTSLVDEFQRNNGGKPEPMDCEYESARLATIRRETVTIRRKPRNGINADIAFHGVHEDSFEDCMSNLDRLSDE